MVNHDQQGIKAGRDREVRDDVIGDLLEGTGCVRLNQGEQENHRMCVGLVLLAHSTVFNILVYKLCQTWPLEFGGNKLASLEITRVTGSLVIVAAGEDRMMEGVL